MSNLRKLKAKQKKLHSRAIPFLMFLLGLITSAVASEAVTIFHELLKEWTGANYWMIKIIIFFGCLFLLGYLYFLIYKDYINPLVKIDRDVDEAEKKQKRRK
jgi:hypothetical protein